ncbi:MAG: hypothetical protein AAGI25_20290, partial [Bacteroidota bacterium]
SSNLGKMLSSHSKSITSEHPFAKPDFWFKSRLSEVQKRSLLVVNEAFEILSNKELSQKVGFSKDSPIPRVTSSQ